MSNLAYVLWHIYGDGSGACVQRVYLDQKRADEDYGLLQNAPGSAAHEWKLDAVPIFGQSAR